MLSFLIAAFFSSLFEEKSIITDLFTFNDCKIVIKLTDTVLTLIINAFSHQSHYTITLTVISASLQIKTSLLLRL